MENKVITVCDLDNFNKQNIEVLLFSNILEKQYDSISVLDLNDLDTNKFVKNLKFKENGEILTTKVFDVTSYNFLGDEAWKSNKALNQAKILRDKNEILIINSSFTQFFVNTDFLNISDEIILFSSLSDHTINNLLNFFMLHKIENKKIYLFIFNEDKNIQTEKSFISLRKQLSKQDIILENISNLPEFKTIEDIEKVDPWLEIYKKINSTF